MNESITSRPSRLRKDRLINLIVHLRDGELHRAVDLAQVFGVSERTIYRDMDTLILSGVPISGTKGAGYRMTAAVTLPPLNLALPELEALNLGLAVMCDATDPELQKNALSLAAKIDAALPESGASQTTGWGLAVFPFADTASGIRHIPDIRQAIRDRKKLRLNIHSQNETLPQGIVHPLNLEYWGRVWTVTVWSEVENAPTLVRVDQISKLTKLEEGF